MTLRTSGATTLAALVAGVILAGCFSSNDAMSTATRRGPLGGQFKISFPHTPKRVTFIDVGVKQSQYGVGVESNTTYASGGNGPPEVNVWVQSLTNVVPPRRVNPFLRSYLENHGGRIIRWSGLPAAEEFVPGCDQSGQCIGTVGNLVVLKGTTLYFVFTHQYSKSVAREVIRSFKVIR